MHLTLSLKCFCFIEHVGSERACCSWGGLCSNPGSAIMADGAQCLSISSGPISGCNGLTPAASTCVLGLFPAAGAHSAVSTASLRVKAPGGLSASDCGTV